MINDAPALEGCGKTPKNTEFFRVNQRSSAFASEDSQNIPSCHLDNAARSGNIVLIANL